jgi:hypothetical protein
MTNVTPDTALSVGHRLGRLAKLGQVSEERQDSRQKLEINPVQVTASALAAVTSAVLLSTLGTAGTIIGAALGSLIATAGGALYSYSIRVSRERVARVQAAAIAKVNRRRTGAPTAQIDVEDTPEEQGRPAWREALTRLPWKWIAIVAAAIFVITMLVIVGFELLTGRSVSTYTGGSDGNGHRTSLGFGSSTHASQSPSPKPSSSTSSTPSANTSKAPALSTTPTTPAAGKATPSSGPSTSLPTPSGSASSSSSPSSSPSG